MRFLNVSEFRETAARIWKELPNAGGMIITKNGRPVAILSPVNESNLEESLAALRRARAIEAVASLQLESVRKGTDRITAGDIDREIKAARRKRPR